MTHRHLEVTEYTQPRAHRKRSHAPFFMLAGVLLCAAAVMIACYANEPIAGLPFVTVGAGCLAKSLGDAS